MLRTLRGVGAGAGAGLRRAGCQVTEWPLQGSYLGLGHHVLRPTATESRRFRPEVFLCVSEKGRRVCGRLLGCVLLWLSQRTQTVGWERRPQRAELGCGGHARGVAGEGGLVCACFCAGETRGGAGPGADLPARSIPTANDQRTFLERPPWKIAG